MYAPWSNLKNIGINNAAISQYMMIVGRSFVNCINYFTISVLINIIIPTKPNI